MFFASFATSAQNNPQKQIQVIPLSAQ